MSTTTAVGVLHAPGNLVRARGREWIVLPGSTGAVLRLRPLSGSEEDVALLHVALEPEVQPATFPPPTADVQAGQEAALLLRDALLMSLRRGAGPFRSFGNVAFEPRAYQLVPLLMALKQDTVRLLIADDVGIGKTIEAGLIARELYDRGEVARFTVLCPPHLVDQWVRELDTRFNLKAVAVTAGSAARLERGLPVNESIFTVYPFTVVSLDYIKSRVRRDDFVRACPELVIVDEAHTCTRTGGARQLRYELLRDLANDAERHLVLLTATPHSGDEEAFYHLLGLLDTAFAELPHVSEREREKLRERLANHFVQRRRPDIQEEWIETGPGNEKRKLFPDRRTTELTYKLTGEWEEFFEAVLDYCADITQAAGTDERRQRLTFWGTLALMRCVSSSPRAAVRALRTRMGIDGDPDPSLQARVFDGASDDLPEDDVEPGADVGDARLRSLVTRAERLAGADGDPKLARLLAHVAQLVKEGFAPVVFCRYVATAHYVSEHLVLALRKAVKDDVAITTVTGELPSEERIRRVEELAALEGRRVLVATDCLSEGVNLQDAFDAVVHYDLSWNPTRHEQREGRVDRYGQKSPEVRATLMYGENNPVDGAVLQVILRKAESIRKELGVPVPIPDDEHTLTQALMQAVLLRRPRGHTQKELFDFTALDEAKALDVKWTSLAEKAKRNNTVFAQRRLKPEEVLPEWARMQAALGAQDDVHRFVTRAMARHGAAPESLGRRSAPLAFRAPLGALPIELRERLAAESLEGTLRIDFVQPSAPGTQFVHRSHPLVGALAEDLLERALQEDVDHVPNGPARLGRVGAWKSPAVEKKTLVVLLRLRHQITTSVGSARHRRTAVLLVEQALPVALVGRDARVLTGDDVMRWLDAPAVGDIAPLPRQRLLEEGLQQLQEAQDTLQQLAAGQARALEDDHRRVREAAKSSGLTAVSALLPVDIMAAYLLLPPV
jgi:superfamily II DNA or RNA helicase